MGSRLARAAPAVPPDCGAGLGLRAVGAWGCRHILDQGENTRLSWLPDLVPIRKLELLVPWWLENGIRHLWFLDLGAWAQFG